MQLADYKFECPGSDAGLGPAEHDIVKRIQATKRSVAVYYAPASNLIAFNSPVWKGA